MKVKKSEYFSSRLGLILSMLGVAIGAGNIWRFSRVVAQHGGGSFIIAWVIFLFMWSIPLIIAEIGMGKLTRKAPIGALAQTAGPRFGWMGAFMALVTTGILFYYSVVCGWGFRYFFYSISGKLTSTVDQLGLWDEFTTSFQPLYYHIGAVIVGCIIIFKGVVNGIEKVNKILIPTLLVMILIIAIRAVTLPGAWEGIEFLFTPNFSDLLNYRLWIEALTQNAWDTGAGWGLLLVYAGYAESKSSITVNGCVTAFGNNAVSLIMGITIFSTLFALEGRDGIYQLTEGAGSSNTGLTFIFLPRLFEQLPGGALVQSLFSSIFFLAFAFAALSSLISMILLTSQVFNELGMKRKLSITLTGIMAILLGTPSALSLKFFNNQDWVWGIGLIVSGLFISFGVIRYGVNRYREEVVNSSPRDFNLGKFYNVFIGFLIPIQAIVLISWFFYQGTVGVDVEDWWNPFRVYGTGTIIFQWGIAFIIFISSNQWIVQRTLRTYVQRAESQETQKTNTGVK